MYNKDIIKGSVSSATVSYKDPNEFWVINKYAWTLNAKSIKLKLKD